MQHSATARQNYLQAEVHTATPQKLQLMLVEAAIKNIHRTKLAWNEEKYDVGLDALGRAQDIVAEILGSLDMDGNPEIAKKLAGIYLFIFRRMAESGMSYDQEKLDDALRVLNSERETWRQVCEKFGSTVGQAPDSAASQAVGQSAEFTSTTGAAPAGQARMLVNPVGNQRTGSPIQTSNFGNAPGKSDSLSSGNSWEV